ncbi:MAG TPA: cytochrome c [Gemmatimonadota bacterium]|jgi:mono/diheme cytochrome c family protein
MIHRLRSLRLVIFGGLLFGTVAARLDGCGEQKLQDLSGREMFLRYCSPCHGEEAKGNGPVAMFMRPQPPDLTKLAAEGKFEEEHVAEVIDGRRMPQAHGTRQMPVWGAVFEEQLRSQERPHPPFEAYLRTITLVDYLRSIQEPNPGPN